MELMNAADAKKQCEEKDGEVMIAIKTSITSAIHNAVKQNKRSIYIDTYLKGYYGYTPLIKKWLEGKGYKYNSYSDQREGTSSTSVSW